MGGIGGGRAEEGKAGKVADIWGRGREDRLEEEGKNIGKGRG